jgi:hypothetical protein
MRIPAPFVGLVGCLVVVPSCSNSPSNDPSQPISAPSSQQPASDQLAATGQRLEPVKLEASDLARVMLTQAWTFQYSGGPVRCWLEIDEDGKKSVQPAEGLKHLGGGPEGRILFWKRGKGEFGLAMYSGDAKRHDWGQVSISMTLRGIAQSMHGFTYHWTQLTESQAPSTGEEHVLLRYETKEVPISGKGREIKIVLKAAFEQRR